MEIETKGNYTFIDKDQFDKIYITVSTECKIKVFNHPSKKWYNRENIYPLQIGQEFSCGAGVSKSFSVLPKDKTTKYRIRITDTPQTT